MKMMVIEHKRENNKLIVALEGRLDTTTSPQLEDFLKEQLGGETELVFDMEQLEYLSSAGLRVLLKTQKQMNTQGDMTICNVNEVIREIFEVTSFINILTIE